MIVIGVIPARGGSKGVHKKNIQMVGGIPLVARSIIALKSVKYINEVFVSSDSDEILKISSDYGASLVKRPIQFASDKSSTEDFLNHFIDFLKEKKIFPDVIVYLQCTSPFTKTFDIENIIETLNQNPALGCVFSAIEDHSFLWGLDEQGFGYGLNHQAYSQRKRRQDAIKQFRETGAIYAFRVNKYKLTNNRFCDKALPYEIDNTPGLEIDTPFDLKMARQLSPIFNTNLPYNFQKNCKALVTDFDGVLTDDKIVVNEFGHEAVKCSRADGMGFEILSRKGLRLLIITREENHVVVQRAKKLKIDIKYGAKDKLKLLKKWAVENNLINSEIAYIGNDINDKKCLLWVGFPFVTSNANSNLFQLGATILSSRGGEGVIRELADLIC